MHDAIKAYLTFNGNCREAMSFYKKCIGGTLRCQTIGDSPHSEQMPEEMRKCILHASLVGDSFQLMASDIVWEEGLVVGNNISIFFSCHDEEQLRMVYEELSEEGVRTQPVQQNAYGMLLGSLTDKFGNHWLLHFHRRG